MAAMGVDRVVPAAISGTRRPRVAVGLGHGEMGPGPDPAGPPKPVRPQPLRCPRPSHSHRAYPAPGRARSPREALGITSRTVATDNLICHGEAVTQTATGVEMPKARLVSTSVLMLAVLAIGATACGSSTPKAASTGAQPTKSAFCGANISIDKASTNVNSDSGFVAVLKAHQSALTTMKNNLPGGSLGTEARNLVNAAEQAVSQNSANPLSNAPSSAGGDLDTYCGVDGNGRPLPKYFASGKGTSFCSTFLPIFQAVGNASDPAGRLAALVAHKTQISQLATEVSGLPSSIQAQAMTTVQRAQTAISENSIAPLQGNGSGPAAQVALYCGQNQ